MGPVFGIGEIFISDNFFKNVSHCNEKEAYKCEIDYENKETLNGEKEFLVEEIEAYKIDFWYLYYIIYFIVDNHLYFNIQMFLFAKICNYSFIIIISYMV